MVRLIPKDTSFFKMFSAMSDNLIAGARSLVDLFADYRDVESKIDEVHRIEREGLLRVQGANYDPGAKLEAIFQPENDQMGETCIRDTVVLIFPTGH